MLVARTASCRVANAFSTRLIKANLAEILPENRQNVQKRVFLKKSPGSQWVKKIQDWILKSERIRKRICASLLNRFIQDHSDRSWWVKGTEESIFRVDSSVPLMHHDPRDLSLISLVNKSKIRSRILSNLRIQS